MADVAPSHQLSAAAVRSAAGRWWENLQTWLNPIMGAVIGLFVLGLFSWAIIQTVGQVNTPPAPPAADGAEGYSAFDRSVQVIGLISPVLTIVLGFYFGARAGSADQAAANQRATVAQEHIAVLQQSVDQASRALDVLQARLTGDAEAQKAFSETRQQFPQAFTPPPHAVNPRP